MNAFDTDVFSEILLGNTAFVSRLSPIPDDQQAIPVIVVVEIVRGRLNIIRQAEAGKSQISIDLAYKLFEETIRDIRRLQILSYTSEAERAYQDGGGRAFESPHTICVLQQFAKCTELHSSPATGATLNAFRFGSRVLGLRIQQNAGPLEA